MYKAKEQSNREFIYFKDIMEYHQHDEFILEKELRLALKNSELDVHFQPKININTNTIHSFEALIRWEKDAQSISPMLFIPIAEKTGLIQQITHFVLDKVFSIAKIWQGQEASHMFSINISAIDFMSDHLIEFIQHSIKKHQVDPSWFELEITENLFLEKTEAIKNRLQELIDMGFHIALDDFGTGYSSLAYLTKFPIKTLKIDKTFIENLETDYDKHFSLLKSIVTLAKELDLNIVAEGVETRKELDALQSLGCHIIQGHYFSKALPLDKLEDLHRAMSS
jgi:EAL domain-containing protein (putative c-di-GMP-specific phosphodiesterase class I)